MLAAKVRWEGRDLSTGETEGGLAEIRVEEVVIQTREVTNGELLRTAEARKIPIEGESATQFEETWDDPSLAEVEEVWYQKRLQLSHNYSLSLCDHPAHKHIQGLGLTSEWGGAEPALGRSLFCWEWFSLTGPKSAEKIQESGSLSYGRLQTPCGNEVVHIRFDTDVSLRLIPLPEMCLMPAPTSPEDVAELLRPAKRLQVFKGSEVWWPSLIEAKNVGNGYVS